MNRVVQVLVRCCKVFMVLSVVVDPPACRDTHTHTEPMPDEKLVSGTHCLYTGVSVSLYGSSVSCRVWKGSRREMNVDYTCGTYLLRGVESRLA